MKYNVSLTRLQKHHVPHLSRLSVQPFELKCTISLIIKISPGSKQLTLILGLTKFLTMLRL